MTSRWQPYLPGEVVADLARCPDAPIGGRTQRFRAAALFVDVADFTPMSEALGSLGSAGTEELTEVLNAYFGPTIDLISSFGGSVATFAGDAMTVLFRAPGGALDVAARRALQCALDMEMDAHRYASIDTAAGRFALRTRVGAAAGTVLWTVGGDDRRLHCVVAGDVLRRCAAAEHAAGHGQVVAHEGVLRLAGNTGRMSSIKIGGSFHRVTGLAVREPAVPPAELPDPPAALDDELRRFLHPAVARRIGAGQERFLDEHRKVTTMFVSFEGLEEAADATRAIQDLVADLGEACDRLGGNLVGVQVGDKGTTGLLAFGAPVTHDDDEVRALACALELRDTGRLPVRIGVTTGLVYSGRVGSAKRRDYTIMGDPVNVAARLMQAAEAGQILVDASTRAAVAGRFSWTAPRALPVKGKAEPVAVAAVRRLLESRPAAGLASDRPLVGRSKELAVAGAALDDARAGRGRVLVVVGDAGVGKTRLAAEIARMAHGRGLSVHPGAFEAYRTRTSYLGWREVWWSLLGADRARERHEAVVDDLRRALAAIDADLVPRLPLLGPVLGVDLPDTDLTRGLDPRLRAELLRTLLLACLRGRSSRSPLLLVLEDCRWMDPLSGELLEFLGRNLASLPVLLLVLYRPGRDHPLALAGLARWAHAKELRLSEIDRDQTATLVRARCQERADAQPSDAFVGAVCDRAGGNPLFAETLVDLVLARGGDLSTAEAAEAPDLPASLSSAVLSRIDELDDDEQITLKLASVVGRRFRPSWLAGSYPAAGTADGVEHRLRTLSRLHLTALEATEPEPVYVFANVTVQEVAYGSLAHATRGALHESTAEYVERAHADDLSPYVELLAHHFGMTRNVAKQRTYFERAGDKAKAAYANAAAIQYYERLRSLPPVAQEPTVLLKLGDVLELVGRWPEAEALYRQAVSSADGALRARGLTALGSLIAQSHSYEEGLPWLKTARTEAEGAGDVGVLGLVLERLSWIHWQETDYAQALQCAREHLRIMTAVGDQAGMGAALENIGVVENRQGACRAAARHLQEARDLGKATGDQRLMVHATNDLAVVHAESGDYVEAVRALSDAAEVAARIGYQRAIGHLVGNEAELRLRQGDIGGALVCARRALRAAAELGDSVTAVSQFHRIAAALSAQGRAADAETLLRRAIGFERTHDDLFGLCDDLQTLAELCAARGDIGRAEALNREAREVARSAQNDPVRFRCDLLAGRLAARDGQDREAAVVALQTLLTEYSGDAEQAAVHYERWRLDRADDESRRRAAELYARSHERAPDIEYRWRYEELTGDRLEGGVPVLPPLPPDEAGAPFDLDELLRDFDTLVTSTSPPPDEEQ